jgi:hypothetical protein
MAFDIAVDEDRPMNVMKWTRRKGSGRKRFNPHCLSRAATRRTRPVVEGLEDRTLLTLPSLADVVSAPAFKSGAVTASNPHPLITATASGFITSSTDVDLYAVTLGPNDTLTASVDTQSMGSGLHPYVRLFDGSGISSPTGL